MYQHDKSFNDCSRKHCYEFINRQLFIPLNAKLQLAIRYIIEIIVIPMQSIQLRNQITGNCYLHERKMTDSR